MAQIIDSSVWLSNFISSDTNHNKAVEQFKKLKGNIILPYCVLLEVSTVLTQKRSKIHADKFIMIVNASNNIEIIDDSFEEEQDYFISHNFPISFTDSALLFLAKKNKATLITFDKQLNKIYKSL